MQTTTSKMDYPEPQGGASGAERCVSGQRTGRWNLERTRTQSFVWALPDPVESRGQTQD
jgi:hypothetical protein